MIKYITKDWGYHKNSTVLLASLKMLTYRHKTIVTYNNEFTIPKNRNKWYVISIQRHFKEYHGIVNFYKKV